jgi:NAD(P)-dependent dehydrogenase (short-subunit alcohol dehydrogenase family)
MSEDVLSAVVTSFRLDGRVAIVTGASSGLGERFTRVLHGAGASVLATARRADRLDALARSVDDPVRFATMTADVAVDENCNSIIDNALERFGRLDVLVNNAGMSAPMAAEDEPPQVFRQLIDVNLNGLFVLSQLAGRHMIGNGGGVIVNVASMLGLVASAPIKQASYCASKGAVVNLTRELAAQWARKGVRVNALAPGWFPSEMTEEMFADEPSMAFINRNCPMARTGESHELDGPLLFLCSDASSYCTGQVLTIDGGWTAR